MSQFNEKRVNKTGYPTTVGIMVIISACMLIISQALLAWLNYQNPFFSLMVPSLITFLFFEVLAILGGVMALNRRSLVFAVFGATLVLTHSVGNILSGIEEIAASRLGINILPSYVTSLAGFIFFIIAPVTLVLSTLSLILLAKSKTEFT
jgi:hypothetical protein